MLFQWSRAKAVLRENKKLRSICHFIMCVLIFSFREHTVLEGNVRVKSPVRLEYDILFSVNIISEFKPIQFCLNRTGERMKEAIHTVLGQECHKEYAEATVAGESIAGKWRGAFSELTINLCENPTQISVQILSQHPFISSQQQSSKSYF